MLEGFQGDKSWMQAHYLCQLGRAFRANFLTDQCGDCYQLALLCQNVDGFNLLQVCAGKAAHIKTLNHYQLLQCKDSLAYEHSPGWDLLQLEIIPSNYFYFTPSNKLQTTCSMTWTMPLLV